MRTFYRTRRSGETMSPAETEAHRRTTRRQGRKRDKMANLQTALAKTEWSEEKREYWRQLVTDQRYVSDEETDSEAEGPEKQFKKRKIAFLSNKAEHVKRKLARIHERSLPKVATKRLLPRVIAVGEDLRAAPTDAPEKYIRRA